MRCTSLSAAAGLLAVAAAAPAAASKAAQPPLVIWHGLGDKYDADGIKAVEELAIKTNPGTFVYSVRLDNSSSADQRATFFGNVTEQIAQVCADFKSHPVLSQAKSINALGFSQGGQFLRGYTERCNDPPVKNLVTFGSQHTGIYEYQVCTPTDWLCKGAQVLLKGNTWGALAQSTVVPSQYFRDTDDLDNYLEHSNFLADINNERALKNQTYRDNLLALNKLVLFIFEDDNVVHPKWSSWFGEANKTTEALIKLEDTPLYKEDWIGLKELHGRGGLVLKTAPGNHMQLSDKILTATFTQWFGPDGAKGSENALGSSPGLDDL